MGAGSQYCWKDQDSLTLNWPDGKADFLNVTIFTQKGIKNGSKIKRKKCNYRKNMNKQQYWTSWKQIVELWHLVTLWTGKGLAFGHLGDRFVKNKRRKKMHAIKMCRKRLKLIFKMISKTFFSSFRLPISSKKGLIFVFVLVRLQTEAHICLQRVHCTIGKQWN